MMGEEETPKELHVHLKWTNPETIAKEASSTWNSVSRFWIWIFRHSIAQLKAELVEVFSVAHRPSKDFNHT